MRLLNKTVGLLAAFALAACGPDYVGSRYVKSKDVSATQDAVLSVDANDSRDLAGTRLAIPAGAVTDAITVSLELGLNSILGHELTAGPAAIFNPSNLVFSKDVTLTLPVANLGTDDELGIVATTNLGETFEYDSNQLTLNADRTLVTFKIRRLGTFQPRRRARCNSNTDCSANLVCVNGRCQNAPPANDGGSCAMSCPTGTVCDPARQACIAPPSNCASNADCPRGFTCDPNTLMCTTGPSGCTSNAQCGAGQVCTNAGCVPAGSNTDGGTDGGTNPGTCNANTDCATGQVCVSGVCTTNSGPTPCRSNLECSNGEVCTQGACTRPGSNPDGGTMTDGGTRPDGGTNTDGGTRPDGGTNTDGGTSTPGSCNANADCATGEICVRNTCQAICSPTLEVCNGVDDNCDGVVDEGCSMSGACRTNIDCATGQVCVSGRCQ